MVKLFAVVALASGLAAPHVHASANATRARVERALVGEENGGPAGRVARDAECRARGRGTFACTIRSVRATPIEARVTVHGDSLDVAWSPLRG